MTRKASALAALAAASAACVLCAPSASAQLQRLNLAKVQTTASDSAAAGRQASFATDGVVGNTNSWMSTGPGPHWLKVTLAVPMQLGSAQLYLGIDDIAPVSNFSLQYFSSNSWVTVPGTSFAANTATVLNVVFSSPITASMVRFYSTDAAVTIRELALFAPNGTAGYPIGTDVSLNLGKKCAVIPSSIAGTNFALNAVDGYAGTNTGWQTANAAGPHTLEVDFTASARVASAQLYSGSGTYPAISNFTLNYWNGSAWTAFPGGTVTGNTQRELNVAFSSPVSTTKVQLSLPGNGTQFVRELAFFAAASGTNIPLWTDVVSNDPPLTTWETYGDGFWSLLNSSNSGALTVSAAGASQAPSNASDPGQQFQVLYNLDSDTFRLRNRASWQCVAAQSAGTSPGTAVITEPAYHAMPHELWRLQDAGGGYYRVVNVWSGLVLETDGQSPATVTLATPSSDGRQQWQLSFRAVYPKKGVAGNEANWAAFGSSWDYNWSRNPNMPAPPQVVFLPQQWNGAGMNSLPQWGPGWHTEPKPMALLGFNEPDQSGQANMTTTNCINLWPQLQAADVPLVGPATSWPLLSWTSNFWSQANSAGLRIDESGVHWYSYPSADTLIGNLQSVYNAWGRPIWITEFGAAFSGGSWSEEMNYNFLAEFLWRAENLACLHRYGVFCFTQDPPTNSWDQTSPISGVFRNDGVTLTPFGQLYAAWDADLTIHTNIPYFLHNKGAVYRISNLGGSSANVANIRSNDLTVQWQLVPSPTANQFYISSLVDGRNLSWNGSALSLAAAGSTGGSVQWSYTHNTNGYFFIDNPATGARLGLSRSPASGQPTTTNLTTYGAGTANDNTRWRFIKPWKPVPIALKVIAGNGQAVLSWNPVPGATSYNIKRATASGGPYATIATGITSTTFTNTGLLNNVTYYFAVSAVFATGESANSAEAPAIPGGTAINCGSANGAGWFGPDSNFSGGSMSSTTSTIDMSGLTNPAPQAVYQYNRFGSSTYTITNLSPNTTYWIRLHFSENFWTASGQRTFNVSVNGSPVLGGFDIFAAAGAQSKAVVRDLYATANGSGQMVIQFTTVKDNAQINGIEVLKPQPLVPGGLAAAADSSQVTLTWLPSAGSTSYNIYRSSSSGGPYSLISTPGTITETGYIDSAASFGSPWYYVVTAANSYGESGQSAEANATLICSPPSTPTAGNNGPLWAGTTLNLTASTVAGGVYSWTGPDGFASTSQNPSIANASTNASGTYNVTVSVGSCVSPAGTTLVAVNPVPSLSFHFDGTTPSLSWSTGTLQTATNLSGPWTPLPDSPNPYPLPTLPPQQFYRLQLQ